MTLGLRNQHIGLAAGLLLGLWVAGCGMADPDGAGEDSSSAGATSGATSGATDGPGASGQYNSSGWEPCGTAGCESFDGGSQWTTGYTSGYATGSDTDDPGPGPLITTGNEDATEWDVTVEHTLLGQAPVQGTYLVTTILYMETEFHGVIEVPNGGGASYLYVDGEYADGVVPIEGTGEVQDITIAGTLQLTDTTLGGAGTFSDANTGDLMGGWEILDATPHG